METVTLKLAATTTDGNPATGRVTLRYDGGIIVDRETAVYPGPVSADLIPQPIEMSEEVTRVGYAEFTVPASNATLPGAGGTYTAVVDLATGDRYTTTFYADKDAPGGVIWLSGLQSVDPDPGTQVTVVTYDDVRGWVTEATKSMVTGGKITGDTLVLTRVDKTEVTAGNVRGPKGDTGPAGSQVPMRVDTSVGTRLYATIGGSERLISAETGLRNITGLLNPAVVTVDGKKRPVWRAVRILLSRHGSQVTLQVVDLFGPSGDSFITLPVGFRTPDWSEFYASNAGSMVSRGSRGADAGSFYLTGTATKALFTATWTTTDPWPTTLPGTAA